MNNKIKSEKYRKLSVAALITGILAVGLGIPAYFFPIFLIAALRLSIAAVVCGSIDLKRIKAGRYSNKSMRFDLTGIVLGVIPILALLVFIMLFEVIFPN